MFGTFNYREKVGEWIDAVRELGCDGWRILCMDAELMRWLEKRGDGAQAVDYYSVLPDAPRYDFGRLDRREKMEALMPLRTGLFLHLAAAGRDFLHSDADALWRQDPRPYLAQQREYDLLMSQGTSQEWKHYKRFGFALCAGFFVCRSNARTRAYFEKVEAIFKDEKIYMDQTRMNEVLLRDREVRWEVRRPVLRSQQRWPNNTPPRLRAGLPAGLKAYALFSRRWRSFLRKYSPWPPSGKGLLGSLSIGVAQAREQSRMGGHRALEREFAKVRWAVRRSVLHKHGNNREWIDLQALAGELAKGCKGNNHCILTSELMIRGRFSDGLTVGVIPMHLVTRYNVTPRDRSLVVH